MKIIVSNDKLREKMTLAIDSLCDTVKTTLGPKGCNVIIDHSSFSPFITNDGATIASNIESDDEIVNTILELAKESSIKTNEIVGDGTTTTLVLLQAIFKSGIKLIEDNYNPIIIKRELNRSLKKIVLEIDKYSRIPNENDLLNISSISSSSKEIGKIISDAYLKVKNADAISIKEGNENKTKLVYKKGYAIESLLASSYFFKEQKELDIDDSYILLFNNYLNSIEDISKIINYIIDKKKSLIIMADDYSNEFINSVLSLYIQNFIKVILLKNPEYGDNKFIILNDIALITKAKVIDNNDLINECVLGKISSVKINKEETVFNFIKNKTIENKIKELEKSENNTKRINMLKNGTIEIIVGEKTETERREKKMRYDDALCAISASLNGVLPGSGIILLKISEKLKDDSVGDKIMKEALKIPFEQIMYNAGLDKEYIYTFIKENNFSKIYNVKKEEFENINNTEVLDPKDVVINSLINATSIASMLLTTTSLVINEYKLNFNKKNDYNDF